MTNEAKKCVESIRSELTKFTSGWTVFKTTLDMQVNPGLKNYRHELAAISHAVRNIMSSSQDLLGTELVQEGMKIWAESEYPSHVFA